jgi:hypothetical protein
MRKFGRRYLVVVGSLLLLMMTSVHAEDSMPNKNYDVSNDGHISGVGVSTIADVLKAPIAAQQDCEAGSTREVCLPRGETLPSSEESTIKQQQKQQQQPVHAWSHLASLLPDRIQSLLGLRSKTSQNSRSDEELKSGIARFYDETTSIWLDVWGDHLHHGYYETPAYSNHRAAQELMIDKSIDWAYGIGSYSRHGTTSGMPLTVPTSMVDIGCGVGGSSRHIIKRFEPQLKSATALSLSPFQIALANNLTEQANLLNILRFQVADALNMPYPDASFDLGTDYSLVLLILFLLSMYD